MRRARWIPWPVLALAALATLPFGGCASAPEEPVAAVDVEFRGTSKLSFRLRRVIEDLLIDFERRPESEVPLFDAALDLQDHFVEQGHPEARVEYELQRAPKLEVVFRVHEGPLVTIPERNVQFRGNTAIPRDELLELWARTLSGQLGLGDPLFVASQLEALQLSILADYDARGWIDVQVQGPRIERADGATTASALFDIDEGARYSFGAIAIDEALPLQPADLEAERLPGAVFDRAAVTALRIRARNHLLQSGYPEPRVDLELAIDRDRHVVDLRLHGAPGPRATVDTVAIEGNERTARYVIARHVRMQEGELYDGSEVEATTSALYRTGLFRRVEIDRTATDDAREHLDMTVRVEEVDPYELDLLAGWGSYETLRGGVFWTDRNLFGLGQRLSAGARVSVKSQGLTTSWQEPYLFGSDTSLTIAGHVREREEPAFVDVSRGVDVALARDLWGPLRGRLGYSLQLRDGSDIDQTIAAVDDRYEIGTVFTELSVDRRDSPLYPSRGHRTSLKLERAGAGGNVEFDRVNWAASWFHSFADDLVLGLSARGGAIWPHGQDPIPLQERFFNGGESSVRSFEESELGPISLGGTPIGGAFFNTYNAELRFPIVAALHGAVFADAGNVGTDITGYGWSDMRYALGAGLRLVLPIGPVRLDAAANPDRRPGDEEWVLHFSVGLPF
ncbi:MAG: outer membrane protein assembly factor BamA [Planctomycetota bacterium]